MITLSYHTGEESKRRKNDQKLLAEIITRQMLFMDEMTGYRHYCICYMMCCAVCDVICDMLSMLLM
jgi:hypothetical protein